MKKLVCLLMVLVLALSLTACGGSGYKGVVKDMMKALEKADAEAMLKLYHEECIDTMIDGEWIEDEDDLVDMMEESFDMIHEQWEDEYGDDIKISYKIKDAEKMDKDDLEDLQDEYDDADIDIDIKQAYEVEVEVTIKGDDDDDEEDMDLVIIKVGGKWYLDTNSGLGI